MHRRLCPLRRDTNTTAVRRKAGRTLIQSQLQRVLTVRDVVFFTVVAVFGLRNLATAAKMGPGVVGLWLLAIAMFFVPLGLAVGELGTRDSGEGGFYRWTRAAFGDTHGFLAGWFYWVSNVTYLPTLLSVIAVSAAYAIRRPELENHQWYAGSFAIGLLWLAAWASVCSLKLGRWVTNFGGVAVWVVGGLVIAAGIVAAVRYGSATSWDLAAAGAGLEDWRTLGYFGTLAFALGGLELIAVMGGEVREPQRTLPRAPLAGELGDRHALFGRHHSGFGGRPGGEGQSDCGGAGRSGGGWRPSRLGVLAGRRRCAGGNLIGRGTVCLPRERGPAALRRGTRHISCRPRSAAPTPATARRTWRSMCRQASQRSSSSLRSSAARCAKRTLSFST